VDRVILINRAPVLTLWAAVVAERLGFDPDASLSLGKAVAGLTAQRKGQRLGIYHKREHPTADDEAEPERIELVGRSVPVEHTPAGLRASIRGKIQDPATTERYLEQKYGDRLDDVRAAFEKLARSVDPEELGHQANRLYEKFRPSIPAGQRGWGAKGKLDLDLVEKLGQDR